MQTQLHHVFQGATGRYLNNEELDVLRNFARTLDERIAAVEELRKYEGAIARETVEKIYQAYPDVRQKYTLAVESGIRDLSLVLRYVSHAVLLNDVPYLDHVLLLWMRTILTGVGFTDDFLRDAYEQLKTSAKQKLSDTAFRTVEPYLSHVVLRLAADPSHTPTGVR